MSTPFCVECLEDVLKKCQNLFKEKGWSDFTTDPSVVEISSLMQELYKNLSQRSSGTTILETLKTLTEKCTQRFNSIRQLSLRIMFARLMLFSRIFLSCYDSETQCFKPLIKLSASGTDDLLTFFSATMKPLNDAIKRKSTLLSIR